MRQYCNAVSVYLIQGEAPTSGFWATSKDIQVLISFIRSIHNLISKREGGSCTTLANVDGLFLECVIDGYASTHCALRQLITQKQVKQLHTSEPPMGLLLGL